MAGHPPNTDRHLVELWNSVDTAVKSASGQLTAQTPQPPPVPVATHTPATTRPTATPNLAMTTSYSGSGSSALVLWGAGLGTALLICLVIGLWLAIPWRPAAAVPEPSTKMLPTNAPSPLPSNSPAPTGEKAEDLERKLRQSLAKGQFLSDTGDESVRTLYGRLIKLGVDANKIREIRGEILPKLLERPNRMLAELPTPGKPEPPIDSWTVASSLLEWACELDPSSVRVRASKVYCDGRVARLHGDIDRSMSEWTEASQIDSSWALPRLSLGILYNSIKRYEMAIAHFEAALKLERNWPAIHNGLASSLRETGEFDRARTHYDAALNLNPNWAKAHYGRGALALLERDCRTSVSEFERVLVLCHEQNDPDIDLDDVRYRLELARDLCS
jgi:hypothetical protein